MPNNDGARLTTLGRPKTERSLADISRLVKDKAGSLVEGLRSENAQEVRAVLEKLLHGAAVDADGIIHGQGTYAWVFEGISGSCTPYGEADGARTRNPQIDSLVL